jgi:hypothetical protein
MPRSPRNHRINDQESVPPRLPDGVRRLVLETAVTAAAGGAGQGHLAAPGTDRRCPA